jgi:hypothetical protein
LEKATPQKKLELLLRQPVPEDKLVQEIKSITITTKELSARARQAPITAWQTLFKAWTSQPPLSVSLLNPSTAEFFYDGRLHNTLLMNMHPSFTIITNPPELTQRDLQRRAKVYLRGYFKALRLSALQALTNDQKQQVLQYASTMTASRDPTTSSRWKKTIRYDMAALEVPADPDGMDQDSDL